MSENEQSDVSTSQFRALAVMLAGGLMSWVTVWWGLEHGLTLTSAPALPWYQFELPMLASLLFSGFGWFYE